MTLSLLPFLRAGLWTNLDNCLDQMYQVLYRVRLLARILSKRRDAGSERSLLEVLQQSGAFDGEPAFLAWAASQLREQFGHAADSANFFKQAFESEFPKLVKLFADFVQRVYSSGLGYDINFFGSYNFSLFTFVFLFLHFCTLTHCFFARCTLFFCTFVLLQYCTLFFALL